MNTQPNNYPFRSYPGSSGKDHVLCCLSCLPVNQKVIEAAARCALAYDAAFTAVYVETSSFNNLTKEERRILKQNMSLASNYGASVQTLQGDDPAYLISEYCKLTHVTQLVVGRSYLKPKGFFRPRSLVDRLREMNPDLEIHTVTNQGHRKQFQISHYPWPHAREVITDSVKTICFLSIAVLIGQVFDANGFDDANIVSVFLLSVMLCCLSAKRIVMCFISSLCAIFLFDYLFAMPRGSLMTYNKGYLVTFGITFAIAMIMGYMTQNMKKIADRSAQSAFRTQTLFDCNRALQQLDDVDQIIQLTIRHISSMTGRNTAYFPYNEETGTLSEAMIHSRYEHSPMNSASLAEETGTALKALKRRDLTGAGTIVDRESSFLYLPCQTATHNYGVIAVELNREVLDALEASVCRSIVSEGSLAIENIELKKAMKEAELKAQSEELRARLLRAISHDLRTPLTAISGNIANLLDPASASFDEEKKQEIYEDINDNSVWLTNLVENLLAASRFEDGTMEIHPQAEMVSDVIEDVLSRPIHKSGSREVSLDYEDDMLMAKMDAQMTARLLLNLVNNAMEYTDEDVPLTIRTFRDGDEAVIQVIDEGDGISEEMKPQIFDMFYVGNRKILDSRKSMGLGLFLCKKIAEAHQGSLSLESNNPHGSVFTLRLPAVSIEDLTLA